MSVVEEQEQFRNKPMPRDSIHRHSRIVRKGRARLTAQLKRLSVYTADSRSVCLLVCVCVCVCVCACVCVRVRVCVCVVC